MGVRVVVKKSNQNDSKTYFDDYLDDVDAALKIFKRKINRDGILQECKKREFYLKPGLKRRAKHENAMKEKRKALKNKKF